MRLFNHIGSQINKSFSMVFTDVLHFLISTLITPEIWVKCMPRQRLLGFGHIHSIFVSCKLPHRWNLHFFLYHRRFFYLFNWNIRIFFFSKLGRNRPLLLFCESRPLFLWWKENILLHQSVAFIFSDHSHWRGTTDRSNRSNRSARLSWTSARSTWWFY